MSRARALALSVVAPLLGAAAVAAAPPSSGEPPARYASALQEELTAMRLAPECRSEGRARVHCTFDAPSTAGTRMHALYSDETDTVYVYLERYASLPPDDPRSAPLLRRMMELNWQLLVGKLEWSARTGEVRLSAVLNTDSNFDRRALRSIVLALDTAASRYRGELGATP